MPEEITEPTIPDNSILKTVKQDLGISEWDDAFDKTIIREINTAFMILNQLGVGPGIGFAITGPTETWDDYNSDGRDISYIDEADIEGVKTYVYKKVKLSFDPSQSSYVNESDKEIVAELEWRLNVAVDPG